MTPLGATDMILYKVQPVTPWLLVLCRLDLPVHKILSFAVVGLTVALTRVVAYHTPVHWCHPSSSLAAMFSPQRESLLGSEKFRQGFIE
ncbi:UNVERIFIED_CONTAM: hypothetical protein Sradi_1994300 [Sesamum radiatum]|uniref:Uncharacterized protein n=1 Tax=Sesamum radiatum TaxID=300843 RepID=A0AAW2TFF8_SESRA